MHKKKIKKSFKDLKKGASSKSKKDFEKRIRRQDNDKFRKSINPLFPGYIAFVKDKKVSNTFLKADT